MTISRFLLRAGCLVAVACLNASPAMAAGLDSGSILSSNDQASSIPEKTDSVEDKARADWRSGTYGPLTSRAQTDPDSLPPFGENLFTGGFRGMMADGLNSSYTIKPGDQIMVSRKPTGTLVLDDLLPGENLYLFSTGTGLAPFLSVIQDPETYERYDKIILMHGVRHVSELAYADMIAEELPKHEYLGEEIAEKLIYYPTVTREEFRNQGRITDLVENGKLFEDIGLPPLDPKRDRAMICGSPAMLDDISAMLDARGFAISPKMGVPGDYVIERAFVEK